MTLTIDQALRLVPVFSNLLATKLPVKLSYRMAKVARTLNEQLRDFNDTRGRLVQSRQVDGKLSEEAKAQLMAELTELTKEALTVDITPFKLGELPEQVEITTGDMLVLMSAGIIEE